MENRYSGTTTGFSSAPLKCVNHPDLQDAGIRRALLRQARQFLASMPAATASEDFMFKALHACSYTINELVEKKSSNKKREFSLRELHSQIYDFLMNANLGLIYNMRQRTRIYGVDSDDLLSEGFWSLYRAVGSFNPWKGFQFSTYACTSILRAYLLVGRNHAKRKDRLASLFENTKIDVALPPTAEEYDSRLRAKRLQHHISNDETELTAMERFVLARRFFHGNRTKADSLETVGTMVDLSKERIRQIQVSALQKLRTVLKQDPVFCDHKSAECCMLN